MMYPTFDEHVQLYDSYIHKLLKNHNKKSCSFDHWCAFLNDFATHILKRNGIFNSKNLELLLGEPSVQRYGYDLGDTVQFYILDMWHDHGLNTEYGRETFLTYS